MGIPSSQEKTVNAGVFKKIPVNGDYTFTQVSIQGGVVGTAITTARPLLVNNGENDFADSEFEFITGGEINLAETPHKRTFTLEGKRLSAIGVNNTSASQLTVVIKQWNLASNN